LIWWAPQLTKADGVTSFFPSSHTRLGTAGRSTRNVPVVGSPVAGALGRALAAAVAGDAGVLGVSAVGTLVGNAGMGAATLLACPTRETAAATRMSAHMANVANTMTRRRRRRIGIRSEPVC
jgi:hypothetical protein